MFLQEHLDYEIIQSTNPDFNKAIVRVNIFREHRQTIQVGLCSCSLLITFANSLDPDQDRHSVGPDLDPDHLTLIVFLREFYE